MHAFTVDKEGDQVEATRLDQVITKHHRISGLDSGGQVIIEVATHISSNSE